METVTKEKGSTKLKTIAKTKDIDRGLSLTIL